MKYFNLLLAVYLLLAGCSQETTDRQTAVDDLAEKVIAEKAEQKKQAEPVIEALRKEYNLIKRRGLSDEYAEQIVKGKTRVFATGFALARSRGKDKAYSDGYAKIYSKLWQLTEKGLITLTSTDLYFEMIENLNATPDYAWVFIQGYALSRGDGYSGNEAVLIGQRMADSVHGKSKGVSK